MKSIVSVKGKQYLVQVGSIIRVDSYPNAVGEKLELPSALVVSDKKVHVDTKKHVVQAKVLRHGLGKKIDILKHHAKKRYRRHLGHRQSYTELRIEAIESKKA